VSLADHLRTSYARLPAHIRRPLSLALGAFSVAARYGPTYTRLRREILAAEADARLSDGLATERLVSLLDHAARHGGAWRGLLAPHANWIASHPREVLELMPVLSREQITEDPEAWLTRPAHQADLCTSSGSSGRPARFYLDKDRSVREWAFLHHIWSSCGFEPDHYRLVLRGLDLGQGRARTWERERALREVRISPFHLDPTTMDHYLGLVDRFRLAFIHGYPSGLDILFRHARERGWRPQRPIRGIIPISETLFPHQRALIHELFPEARIARHYGLSEKVVLAAEQPGDGEDYVFEPLYGCAELLDESGRPVVRPGEAGTIVGTGFISRSMPLIRYDTGDKAVLVEAATPENGQRLRVRRIRSRWGQEMVVGRSGARISIAAINIHSPAYASVSAFQIVQERPGEAELQVIPRPRSTPRELDTLLREFQAKVGRELRYTLRVVDHLHVNARGKQPFIHQLITAVGPPPDEAEEAG
jgi:phenylacetate-CoA ligase